MLCRPPEADLKCTEASTLANKTRDDDQQSCAYALDTFVGCCTESAVCARCVACCRWLSPHNIASTTSCSRRICSCASMAGSCSCCCQLLAQDCLYLQVCELRCLLSTLLSRRMNAAASYLRKVLSICLGDRIPRLLLPRSLLRVVFGREIADCIGCCRCRCYCPFARLRQRPAL